MALEKVTFNPNVPIQVALKFPEGKIVEGRFGDQVYFTLAQPPNSCMYLDMGAAQKVNVLSPQKGQAFNICKRWTGKKGDPVQWDVWGPQTGEVNTAAQSTAPSPAALAGIPESDIEAEVRAEVMARRARAGASVSAPAPVEAATVHATPNNGNGTPTNGNGGGPNGNGANARPYQAAGVPTPPTKIPMNIAVSEAVRMVQNAMKETGEQWSDASKQDLVSTILITAQREGWITLWQRGGIIQ
jgi:hypothetical protein